jgi:5-methylcytosine-specific restriction endonuclease McrA
LGGNNWPSNLQLTCPTCNHHKHGRDPIEFYRSLGFLL